MGDSFGSYVKELRKKKEFTLVQLSEISGVSNPYLSQIENDKFTPSPDILRRLSAPLGVRYMDMLHKAGYVEDEESLNLLKEAKEEKVFKLRGTQSSYMVDLSNLGEDTNDLEEYLKDTLLEPLFYGDKQLTTDEQSFVIGFIELLLEQRKSK